VLCYTGSVLIKTVQEASDPSLLRIILVAVLYSLFVWRTIKSNQGNRVIACGCVALMVFMVLIVLINIKGLPEWMMPALWCVAAAPLSSDNVLLGTADDSVSSSQQIKIKGLNAIAAKPSWASWRNIAITLIDRVLSVDA
jgi:hypothetical protein